MYCPNCGTKTSSKHKFCRACGLALEEFAVKLAEQLPAGEDGRERAEELARLAARGRRVGFLLNAAASTFIALLVGTVLYGIIVKLIIEKGEIIGGLIFLSVILLGLSFAGLIVYREALKEKLQKRLEPEPLRAEATGRLLPESRFEPVPSVTERTTDLLAVEPGGAGRGERRGSRQ